MIQLLVTFCTCDDLPIDASPAYKAIRELYSEEIANRLTYEKAVPDVGNHS